MLFYVYVKYCWPEWRKIALEALLEEAKGFCFSLGFLFYIHETCTGGGMDAVPPSSNGLGRN